MTLREAVDRYVAWQRDHGAKFRSSAQTLDTFCRRIGEGRDCDAVGEDDIRRFLAGNRALTRSRAVKYGTLAGFYGFALSRGHVSRIPMPPREAEPRAPEVAPSFIFTHEELRRLFKAAGGGRRRCLKLDIETFRTFLILLYGAGLRSGEARRLTLADVDLDSSLLAVNGSKFYKNVDRIVMLSGARMSLSTKDMEPRSLNITMMHFPHHHRRGGESHHAFKATAPYTRGSTRRPIPINDFAVCRVSAPCGPFRVQHRRLSRAGSALPDLVGRGGHRSRFGGRRRGTAISESRLHVSADGLYGQIYSFLAVRSLRGPDCMVCQIP